LNRIVGIVSCLALSAATLVAHAQPAAGYPTRPVRMLVGSSSGGGVDLISRAVAQKLTEHWGQSVLVENRTGGGGVLAVTLLSQATPDGHTLYGGGSQVVTLTPLKKVPFDTRKALAPISQLTASWYVFLIHPSVPARSVKEFIAFARAKPGTLNYASAGTGSSSHLGTALFASKAGIDMLHVPYKGNGQALIDLVAGQVHVLFTSTISGMQHVKSGRARGIAVTSPRRIAAFPELATVSESGLPGFEMQNMYGLYAPAGVPAALQAKIARDVGEIMNSPEVREKVTADGAEVAPTRSPAEFAKRFAQEMDMWDKFIKSSGIKVE
jgi:tripartite-type tricarboxylate transporter receptor subunit TctC